MRSERGIFHYGFAWTSGLDDRHVPNQITLKRINALGGCSRFDVTKPRNELVASIGELLKLPEESIMSNLAIA